MLNHKGEVAECTGDNIFLVRGGKLLTPPNDAGILEGITREAVIELARDAGIEVREIPLTKHDVYIADECFLTGTAAEVVPVVKVDSRTIGDGTPGPITRDLMDRFHKLTRSLNALRHTAGHGTPPNRLRSRSSTSTSTSGEIIGQYGDVDLPDPVRDHLLRDRPGGHAVSCRAIRCCLPQGRLPPTGGASVAGLDHPARSARRRGDPRRHRELLGRGLRRPAGLQRQVRFLKKEYLDRTHRFYERYGGKTIILARFIPIIRTFAPFVAGIGAMNYPRFIVYNVAGGAAWVLLFVGGGYFFGNLPWVKQNFIWVVVAIIAISVMPIVVEYLRSRRRQ